MNKHKNQIDMESDLPIVSTVETRYARYNYTTICTSIYHLSTISTTIHILYLHIIYVLYNSPIQLFSRTIYTNMILSRFLLQFNKNNDAVKASWASRSRLKQIGLIAVRTLLHSSEVQFRGKSELEEAGWRCEREGEDLSNRESPVCAFVDRTNGCVSEETDNDGWLRVMRVSQAHTMPASSYVASCPNEPTELLLSLHLCRTPQRNATPDQRSPLALPLLLHSLPLKPWILYGSPLPCSLPPLSVGLISPRY